MSGYLKKMLKKNKKPALADQPKPESKQNSSRSIFSKKGDEIFRNTFPILSIIVDKLESNEKDDSVDRTRQSIARENSIRKSDAIAINLASLTIEQGKIVTLLKELLDVVKDLNSGKDAKPTGNSGLNGGLGGLGSKLAAGAAAATLGGALYNTQNNEANRRDQPAGSTNPQQGNAPATNQPAVTRETQERTVANFSLARFRENDPEGAREYEAKLRDRRKELIDESIRRTPAYQSGSPATRSLYMQGFESSAESRAMAELLPQYAERITAARAGTIQHVQTPSASPLSTAPAVSLPSVPAEQNTTQTPRISSGTQPRITRPPAATEQPVPESATRIRSNDRFVGYMPTVTSTDSARAQVTRSSQARPVSTQASPSPDAPGLNPLATLASMPAPAGAASSTRLLTPTSGRITSPFGMRSMGNHEGIDYGVPVGTPIVAAHGGTVVEVRESSSYGNMIRIRGDNGTDTLYAHLSSFGVQEGQQVTAGQQIALSGNTGRSTGPHLHFEAIRNGTKIDPAPLLGLSGSQSTQSAQSQTPEPAPSSSDASPISSTPATAAASIASPAEQSAASTPAASAPTTGAAVVNASQANAVAERIPAPATAIYSESAPAGQASAGASVPGTFSSPTEPGNVEPVDSAERYARLFNMAA